ncbi:VOC family protein [Rhodococcus sp. TAF43]|uniref:VOC family protein n=1 Tax=unclassified Rhodococcus (in: high G+C Gram-positive bacteria) TaxID=192944 RepID=UPI001582C879|nr:VOC family protein [Rhodococcus sp. W8901]QKT10702.1 VOC family protein [Rhodococcus sp. W8901]
MQKITPCLWFDTEGEAAAQFYTSVFKNSKIRNISRYGPDMHRPEGLALTIEFELDGQNFTILNGGPEFTFDEAISFQVSCADQSEVDAYWTQLTAAGGQESQCGWLKDRFGVSWQIIPAALGSYIGGPDSEGAQRATQAMLGMRKLDIGVIRAAYEGS